MNETSAAVEADIRSRYEHRLREALREAESRIRAEYEVWIEEAVQVAVVEAERTAHEETLGRLEPGLLADTEDAADAIRVTYDARFSTRSRHGGRVVPAAWHLCREVERERRPGT
jgi:hypothetical protein